MSTPDTNAKIPPPGHPARAAAAASSEFRLPTTSTYWDCLVAEDKLILRVHLNKLLQRWNDKKPTQLAFVSNNINVIAMTIRALLKKASSSSSGEIDPREAVKLCEDGSQLLKKIVEQSSFYSEDIYCSINATALFELLALKGMALQLQIKRKKIDACKALSLDLINLATDIKTLFTQPNRVLYCEKSLEICAGVFYDAICAYISTAREAGNQDVYCIYFGRIMSLSQCVRIMSTAEINFVVFSGEMKVLRQCFTIVESRDDKLKRITEMCAREMASSAVFIRDNLPGKEVSAGSELSKAFELLSNFGTKTNKASLKVALTNISAVVEKFTSTARASWLVRSGGGALVKGSREHHQVLTNTAIQTFGEQACWAFRTLTNGIAVTKKNLLYCSFLNTERWSVSLLEEFGGNFCHSFEKGLFNDRVLEASKIFVALMEKLWEKNQDNAIGHWALLLSFNVQSYLYDKNYYLFPDINALMIHLEVMGEWLFRLNVIDFHTEQADALLNHLDAIVDGICVLVDTASSQRLRLSANNAEIQRVIISCFRYLLFGIILAANHQIKLSEILESIQELWAWVKKDKIRVPEQIARIVSSLESGSMIDLTELYKNLSVLDSYLKEIRARFPMPTAEVGAGKVSQSSIRTFGQAACDRWGAAIAGVPILLHGGELTVSLNTLFEQETEWSEDSLLVFHEAVYNFVRERLEQRQLELATRFAEAFMVIMEAYSQRKQRGMFANLVRVLSFRVGSLLIDFSLIERSGIGVLTTQLESAGRVAQELVKHPLRSYWYKIFIEGVGLWVVNAIQAISYHLPSSPISIEQQNKVIEGIQRLFLCARSAAEYQASAEAYKYYSDFNLKYFEQLTHFNVGDKSKVLAYTKHCLEFLLAPNANLELEPAFWVGFIERIIRFLSNLSGQEAEWVAQRAAQALNLLKNLPPSFSEDKERLRTGLQQLIHKPTELVKPKSAEVVVARKVLPPYEEFVSQRDKILGAAESKAEVTSAKFKILFQLLSKKITSLAEVDRSKLFDECEAAACCSEINLVDRHSRQLFLILILYDVFSNKEDLDDRDFWVRKLGAFCERVAAMPLVTSSIIASVDSEILAESAQKLFALACKFRRDPAQGDRALICLRAAFKLTSGSESPLGFALDFAELATASTPPDWGAANKFLIFAFEVYRSIIGRSRAKEREEAFLCIVSFFRYLLKASREKGLETADARHDVAACVDFVTKLLPEFPEPGSFLEELEQLRQDLESASRPKAERASVSVGRASVMAPTAFVELPIKAAAAAVAAGQEPRVIEEKGGASYQRPEPQAAQLPFFRPPLSGTDILIIPLGLQAPVWPDSAHILRGKMLGLPQGFFCGFLPRTMAHFMEIHRTSFRRRMEQRAEIDRLILAIAEEGGLEAFRHGSDEVLTPGMNFCLSGDHDITLVPKKPEDSVVFRTRILNSLKSKGFVFPENTFNYVNAPEFSVKCTLGPYEVDINLPRVSPELTPNLGIVAPASPLLNLRTNELICSRQALRCALDTLTVALHQHMISDERFILEERNFDIIIKMCVKFLYLRDFVQRAHPYWHTALSSPILEAATAAKLGRHITEKGTELIEKAFGRLLKKGITAKDIEVAFISGLCNKEHQKLLSQRLVAVEEGLIPSLPMATVLRFR